MGPVARRNLNAMTDGMLVAAVAVGAAVLVWLMYGSLETRMRHDSAILMYSGYLVAEQGFVPYRDIFDVNLPLTFLIFAGIVKLFGTSDLSMRAADLLWLSATLGATVFMLRRLGWAVAGAAAVLFGMAYLGFGWAMMQRDYLLILPVALAVGSTTLLTRRTIFVRGLAAGFFFALAGAIKPHALIGLPIVWAYLLSDHEDEPKWTDAPAWRRALVLLLALVVGALPITAGLVGWLAYAGALDDFLSISRHYLPLFGSLAYGKVPVEGDARWAYLWREWRSLGNLGLWWYVGGLAGLYVGASNTGYAPRERRYVWMLAGLAAAYCVYPLFSGHFHGYHWTPFLYFLACLCALLLVTPRPDLIWAPRLIALGLFALVVFHETGLENQFKDQRKYFTYAKNGGLRADHVARALAARLEPGDTVQPLDWVWGGTLHALLMNQTPIATPYLYTAYLEHHVNDPYVREQRQQFLADLKAAPPRFVVQIKPPRPFVFGRNTSNIYTTIGPWLRENYREVIRRSWCTLWERRADVAAEPLLDEPPTEENFAGEGEGMEETNGDTETHHDADANDATDIAPSQAEEITP